MIQSIEEGRKEDGHRSIADKIKKRLHNLDKTAENNQGRWAWELLQNAKDSIAHYPDRKISVQIELDENQVIFRLVFILLKRTSEVLSIKSHPKKLKKVKKLKKQGVLAQAS
tara:strand:+ start:602 stop:937 length:336 start_codon:yes stop_codon:yes gene_type:complete